jgi:hypothetical protein
MSYRTRKFNGKIFLYYGQTADKYKAEKTAETLRTLRVNEYDSLDKQYVRITKGNNGNYIIWIRSKRRR